MKEYSLFWIKPDVYNPKQQRDEHNKLKKDLPENPYDFISIVKDWLKNHDLEIIAEKETIMSYDLAELHYEEHKLIRASFPKERSFEWLIEFMISWNIYWIIFYWEDAIKKWREFLYDLRWEYLYDIKARMNMTHAADSIESANREIELHFPELADKYKNTIL